MFQMFHALMDLLSMPPRFAVCVSQVTRSYKDADGNKKWTGGKDMKATQNYPTAFGLTFGRLHKENVGNAAEVRVPHSHPLLSKLVSYI